METITDQPAGIIVKSDRSGRTRYTVQYKQEVIAAYESSSLSGPDFAKQCGIKYPNLAASGQQSTSYIFCQSYGIYATWLSMV